MLLSEYFHWKYAQHHKKGVLCHKPVQLPYIRVSHKKVTLLKAFILLGFCLAAVLPMKYAFWVMAVCNAYWLFFLKEDTK